jgi:hypothetical protein
MMENMKEFEPGDMWSENFDYEGMLRYGENISVNDDVEELEKLFRSFEDVNYHREASPLYNMIEAIKGKQNDYQSEIIQSEWDESIKYHFNKFQEEIKETLNS